MPARQKKEIPVDYEENILASCNPSTYNDSSIIAHSRIVTPSDPKFSDKLRERRSMKMYVKREVLSIQSHT
jgi:hypothetical protein